MKPRFELGQTVITPGALQAFASTGENPHHFVNRHHLGDWGELDDHDRKENEDAVEHGYRILSAYHLEDGTKFWIITEADRSVTTILLPEEY